jgi:thiol-disulfide isomerase/thioredoxin
MAIVVGLIHADWCGHCQRLMPEWNAMKTDMIQNGFDENKIYQIEAADGDKQSKIDSVNGTLDRNIENNQLVENGYPSIFKVDGNRIYYYSGNRTPAEMKQWFLQKETANETQEPPKKRNKKNKTRGGKSKKSKKSSKNVRRRKTSKKNEKCNA